MFPGKEKQDSWTPDHISTYAIRSCLLSVKKCSIQLHNAQILKCSRRFFWEFRIKKGWWLKNKSSKKKKVFSQVYLWPTKKLSLVTGGLNNKCWMQLLNAQILKCSSRFFWEFLIKKTGGWKKNHARRKKYFPKFITGPPRSFYWSQVDSIINGRSIISIFMPGAIKPRWSFCDISSI